MSDKRRQRKSSSNKNANANSLYNYRVLPKETRNDRGDKSLQDPPKILQKPREEKPASVPVQISIAPRPVDITANDTKSASSTQKFPSTSTSTQSTSKESKDTTANEVRGSFVMHNPTSLISDYYQINNQAFDHIIETNAAFFVVGVIGAQGVGKSTILNLVGSTHSQQQSWPGAIVNPVNPIFRTRQSAQAHFSNMPVTEGIEIFITADRTILLDCSPVICNPYKKDLIMNEIDDLKTTMFLLTVCHTLIVVDEGSSLNLPLIRLIQCAEKMKLDYDRNSTSEPFSPNILFVKNKCRNNSFLNSKQDELNAMYKYLFKDSKLKIDTDIHFDGAITDAKSLRKRKVNVVYIPTIDPEGRLSRDGIIIRRNLSSLYFRFHFQILRCIKDIPILGWS